MQHLLSRWGETANAQIIVHHDDWSADRTEKVCQVVVSLAQLNIAALHLRVDRVELFVGRLQLFLRRLQFFVTAL